jgi:hypothetical protein
MSKLSYFAALAALLLVERSLYGESLPLPEGPLFAANRPVLDAEPNLAPAPIAAKPSASQNLTLNLIKRLVERGVLPKEDAAELVRQAETETAEAQQYAAVAQQQTIDAAVSRAVAQVRATPDPDAELFAASGDAVRATYIPENIRAQMREEIKQDVMNQAREERWAAPRLVPEWSTRIRLFGDVRVRAEGDFFQEGNDNTGAFPNFNSINTGQPFDISGTNFAPQLNVDQDRERLRLRVRIGAEADLGHGFSAGLRIATGENNNPVSTNQSLGLANQGQGGNFSKYAIWLDRGYLRYDYGADPDRHFGLSLGRFENPFYSTEIIYDEDLGFDGAAVQGRYRVAKNVVPFFSAGAFPVFNTDFNFGTNQPAKFKSSDKWLYGAQLGVDWKLSKDFNFKAAAAYYHFDNVEGQLSDPFTPLSPSDQGNTDNSRPSFAQKGNTYRPLRRIIASPLNNFGTANQYQYYGLATPFHNVAVTGQLTYNRWEPFQISLSGEWVKNVAFDRNAIDAIAVNNRGANGINGAVGRFAGGDTAWILGLRAGAASLQKRWDWQVGLNYRYIESDSVIDGLNDSEFGLGGTNLKGYSLYGNLALSPRVAVGLRWMSADEIAGPPMKVDVLQLDFSGKF